MTDVIVGCTDCSWAGKPSECVTVGGQQTCPVCGEPVAPVDELPETPLHVVEAEK